jgi:hypothetical protein
MIAVSLRNLEFMLLSLQVCRSAAVDIDAAAAVL